MGAAFYWERDERRAVDMEKKKQSAGSEVDQCVRCPSMRGCVCVTAGDAGPAAAAAVDPYLDKALSFSSLCTPKGQTSPCAVSEMETLVSSK
jgi:hypothetical protein